MDKTIYTGLDCRKELKRGEYKGYRYHIVTYGTHPCCYVEIMEGHPCYMAGEENADIYCHGGITFTSSGAWFETEPNAWIIGWDYAHCGDAYCYAGNALSGEFYTMDDLDAECRNVIDQLEKKTLVNEDMCIQEAISQVLSVNKGDVIPDRFWKARDIVADYADSKDVEDAENIGKALAAGFERASKWHLASEELPEDGELILMTNGKFYETIYYPEPPATDNMVAWMPIVEFKGLIHDKD